jgi:hypothetical protein
VAMATDRTCHVRMVRSLGGSNRVPPDQPLEHMEGVPGVSCEGCAVRGRSLKRFPVDLDDGVVSDGDQTAFADANRGVVGAQLE